MKRKKTSYEVKQPASKTKDNVHLSNLSFKTKSIEKICEDKNINSKSNSKIALIPQLLPHLDDVSYIDKLDDHEIVSICHFLKINSISSVSNRRNQLKQFIERKMIDRSPKKKKKMNKK